MRAVFKVVLVVVAGFSLLLVLLAGVFGAALSVLWSAITGRKPRVIARVTQFNQAATHPLSRHGESDVVDVQSREVGGPEGDGPVSNSTQKALN